MVRSGGGGVGCEQMQSMEIYGRGSKQLSLSAQYAADRETGDYDLILLYDDCLDIMDLLLGMHRID